jgi:hypothetical protein
MMEFLEKFMGEMSLIGKSLTRSSRTPPPLVKHHVHRHQLAPEMADITSILGIVVEAWRSWRSKLLGWLGNPGKHRRDPNFRSEVPRIVLLVVRIPTRKFSTPSPFSATLSRFQARS